MLPHLTGTFVQTRKLAENVACVYVLDIQGSIFRETQVALDESLRKPSQVAQDRARKMAEALSGVSPDVSWEENAYKELELRRRPRVSYAGDKFNCPSFMTAGIIEVENPAPPDFVLMTYSFDTSGAFTSRTYRRLFSIKCPRIVMLDRKDGAGERELKVEGLGLWGSGSGQCKAPLFCPITCTHVTTTQSST
jgi:hypothetical protein